MQMLKKVVKIKKHIKIIDEVQGNLIFGLYNKITEGDN